MSNGHWSQEQLELFDRDGFLIVRGLFTGEEIGTIREVALLDIERRQSSWASKDAAGRSSQVWFDTNVKDDIYGALVRCARVVGPAGQILGGGAIYPWHYKMMQKEPRVGGAWEWHQDYGYWYGDKCLFPDMVSCMTAVTHADRGNGCLQVVRGSHRLGRVDHGVVGGQAGADPARVAVIIERMQVVYGELDPGDSLFFHCNTLHCSGPNTSDRPRWSFIGCYNAMANAPFEASPHGAAVELVPMDDAEVLPTARRQLERIQRMTAAAAT